ncbi:MAG: hypothetical protein K2H43_02740, partial [Clostridia bacterium]|nr:hypothetical protein [Clostridia bacterium]
MANANKKRRKVIFSTLIASLSLAAVALFGVACGGSGSDDVFTNARKTITTVGYDAEYLGTVKRNIPQETHDGGLASGYPKYGYTLNEVIGGEEDKVAARNALIREANSLTTAQTWNGRGPYEMMDKDGYLYLKDGTKVLDDAGNHRKLYKHTASVGLYEGDVSDDEPAIVKKLTYRPRSYSSYYELTGVYAPAGEILKIEISEADMNATNGISV